ncbi:unnamed protein product [Mycena citricolor]|uniref:Chromatin modification-related protein n=1 Tax=Mycena citricolor TaxID=2018698 RepID=A0AAD2Q6N5_9AGAR|nr:unnamed protein product [Mycena citricolor]CAK5279927.1 unnamed protein product [Mycena citricolor]
MRGEVCVGSASILSIASLLLLIFVHIGQTSTHGAPGSISLVKINVSDYGASLNAALFDPIDGLYTNNASAPLSAGHGLRQSYAFGLYSFCGYINASHGTCSNHSIQTEFTPLDALTGDMLPNYTDVTRFIFDGTPFADSGSFAHSSRAAYWMIFLGTICAALSILTGVAKAYLTFFLSTIFSFLGSIFLLVGAAIWTAMIHKAQYANSIRIGTAANPVNVHVQVSVGIGIDLLWAAFAALFMSVVPYMISCCLDNLPNEVAHLLQEIREKDSKVQELQQEIDRETSRYIRHALKPSPTPVSSSPSPASGSNPTASRDPSPKSAHVPGKVSTLYATIHTLSSEKIALAQRIIDLVTRTRARLDADLTKVRVLHGELPDPRSGTPASDVELVYSGAARTPNMAVGVGSNANAAAQISESLRSAMVGSSSMSDLRQQALVTPSTPVSAGPAVKKRRVNAATPAIKLVPVSTPTPPRRSASPLTSAVSSSAAANSQKRSRLSRQIPLDDPIDVEEDGEGEDEGLYCFCQKQSYGDMIACDNDDCPTEWFHLSCVGLTLPTPEKWYCRECVDKGFGVSSTQPGRKGRKR